MAVTSTRRARRYVHALVGMSAVGLTAGVLAPGALATGPTPPSVVNVDTSSVSFDLTVDPAVAGPTTITVGLDGNCSNALDNGQSYTIVPTFPSFVTVSPGVSPAMHCGDTTPFSVAPVATGFFGTQSGTIVFSPVVANNGNGNPTGIQKKVAAGSATVSVKYPDDETCSDCVNEIPGSPAAAPAIANGYLDAALGIPGNPALISACHNKGTNKNKSNWRGSVISFIAQDPNVMPGWVRFVNFGVDPNDDSTWGVWTSAVENEVNNYCNYVTV